MTMDWLVSQALTSVRQLMEVLPQLTEEQLNQLITLEESAQRRKVFLDKLYRESRQRARSKFAR